LETVRVHDLENVRVHDGLARFRFNSIKLEQVGGEHSFGYNEGNIIPLQLQTNFSELREDICGL